MADGLTWKDSAGRTFTVSKADLKDWIGNRAEARAPAAQRVPEEQQFVGCAGPARPALFTFLRRR